jgi:predicted outer membrane protein
MTARKTSLSLAVTTGLALGGAVFAQQQQSDRNRQPSGQTQGQQGQQGQGQQQADPQQAINQVLAQIAQDPKTAADKLFLLTATLHNQSEIALAKEVMTKTQNDKVKQMAQQMLKNLEQTHDQLLSTARAIGLEIPQELARAAVAEVGIVAALPADQIDQQYTAAVQADNAEDLSQFQSQAQIAQDPRVRRMAQDQVAGAQRRSQDGNEVARGLNMPSGSGGEAQPAGATIRRSGDAQQNR